MKIQLLSTLKKYKKDYLKQDIFSGIIIAAVSIPISMGYAQIAGLPPAYGLYGSILPILLFAIFSTSKQFIFGVDAAPAALAGSALLSLGIVPGSEAALNYIPILALFTGLWLLFFYIIKADRIVNFISTPVMGGFISGISSCRFRNLWEALQDLVKSSNLQNTFMPPVRISTGFLSD